MPRESKNEFIKSLKRIMREERLAREKQFGKLKSKSWDEKPSSKDQRRKFKQDQNIKPLDELE